MTTVDEINGAITRGLIDAPHLLGVSSVQIARLAPEEYIGTMVLIRTQPELSGIMARCQQYQYALHMPLNVMMCLSQVAEYLQDGDLLPMPNEMTCLALCDTGKMEEYGFKVDLETKLITSPRVPLAQMMEASDRKRQRLGRQLGKWGPRLLAAPWLGMTDAQGDELPLGIDFVHLPDLPSDDIADPQLEHIICLAMGWNFAAMVEPAAMKQRIANLRRAINEAQTAISY